MLLDTEDVHFKPYLHWHNSAQVDVQLSWVVSI